MNMTMLSVCLGGVAGSTTLASTSVREEPWWPLALRQYVARGDRQGERDRKGTSECKKSPCQSEKGRRRGQGQVVLRRLGEM